MTTNVAPQQQPDPIRAFLALPATILTTIVDVAKAAVASFAPPAPGAPANPPLLWAVLAVVRREFFNPPVTVNYTVSAPDSSGKITISLDQADAGGNPLSYTATNGDKGTVALNADGHSFTYTPTAGQTGTDTVTVTATDPSITHINGFAGLLNALSFGLLGDSGRTATAAVGVTLDTPPVFSSLSSTTDANGIVTGTVKFTDAEANPLTYSGSVTTIKGAVAITPDGSFTYTPTADERNVAAVIGTADTDQFTVSANDGHGGTGTTNVTVTILPAVIPSNPTPSDIATDPQAALTAAQSAIAADTAAYQSVQAIMGKSITAYNTKIDPAVLQTNIDQIKAQSQASLTAQIAQMTAGTSGAGLPDPMVQLEDTIGPLTSDQMTNLLNEQKANFNSQQALLQSITAAQNAQAAITAKTATTPVFNRVDYTVGGDGSISGQVYFVDPQSEAMNIYGVGDNITPHFDQTGTGTFTIPASVIAGYPSPFSMYVKATDTSNNATTVKVTFDQSLASAPPAIMTKSQVLTAFSTTFNSIGSAVASFQSTIDQADAEKIQAQSDRDQALVQQLDGTIAQTQASLANAVSNFIAAQNNLGAGYTSGVFANLPS